MEGPAFDYRELLFILPVMGLAIVCYLIPCWRICSKAGYSGALVLLMCIPVVNIVLIYVFAFSKWPIERRLAQLQSEAQQPPPPK